MMSAATQSAEKDFRDEVRKLLPGYRWVIRRRSSLAVHLEAVGAMSSGSNRLSTLTITRLDATDGPIYSAASSRGRVNARDEFRATRYRTLPQAVRALQSHYEYMAQHYAALADHIATGRQAPSV